MYKIKLYNKKSKDDIKDTSRTAAGLGLALTGAKILKDSNKEGEITGRVGLYHNTLKKNVPGILKEGLKGSHSKDPNNITNQVTRGRGASDPRNIVYLAKDKSTANDTTFARNMKGMTGKSKTLKVNLPYDVLKELRTEGNPELGNAKNLNDYLKSGGDKETWNKLSGSKNSKTILLDGDVSSKYIKGSKDYQKNSLKEVGKYIKRNPGRFAKGVGKAGLGLGLVAGGAKLLNKEDSSEGLNVPEAILAGSAAGIAGTKVTLDSLSKSKDNIDLMKLRSKTNIESKANQEAYEVGNKVMRDLTKDSGFSREAANKSVEARMNHMNKVKPSIDKARSKSDKIIKSAEKLGKVKSVGKGLLTAGAIGGSYIAYKNHKTNKKK